MVGRIIFTIASRNYSAQVEVLLDSLSKFEPECVRIVIATDGPMPSLRGKADIIEVEQFLEGHRTMALYYDAVEFNTAVKPYAFSHIFEKFAADKVVYLDPDVVLFDSISPVFVSLEHANVALTPHLYSPLSMGGMPNDLTILRSGSFNLGFLGLRQSEETARFLVWWRQKCLFDCRVDPTSGLFTDQRWIDLAPGMFEGAAILRDPGLNLAYWNLEGRRIADDRGRWTVDGRPLRFFHFSGYSPFRPDVLSKYQDRIWPARSEPLSRLLRHYAGALMGAGYSASSATPYAYASLANGRKLSRLMRRTILKEVRAGGGFDEPFGVPTSNWLDGSDQLGEAATELHPTRIMAEFLRETEAGAGYRPWSSMEQSFDLFIRHGSELGADRQSILAAISLRDHQSAEPGGLPGSELEDASDDLLASRLPKACIEFWRSNGLVQSSYPLGGAYVTRCETFVGFCMGSAALRGEFEVESISSWLMELSSSDVRRLARRALYLSGMAPGAFAEAYDGPLDIVDIIAAYGLGPKANWPVSVISRLHTEIEKSVRGQNEISAIPAFAIMIWRSRGDLIASFDISKVSGRIRYCRWLFVNGVEEYSLDRSSVAAHLAFSSRVFLQVRALLGRSPV